MSRKPNPIHLIAAAASLCAFGRPQGRAYAEKPKPDEADDDPTDFVRTTKRDRDSMNQAMHRRIHRRHKKDQDKGRTRREMRKQRGVVAEKTGGPVCCLEPMPWSKEDGCYFCPVCDCTYHPDTN